MTHTFSRHGGWIWSHRAAPEWGLALCWQHVEGRVICQLRRRWASDKHIGLSRALFALYVGDFDVVSIDLPIEAHSS